MNFLRLVIFLVYWNFTDAKKKPALLFDWANEKLVEISKFDDKTSCKCCLSACPFASNSSSEKLLNDEISLTKKSLFLRHVYLKNNGQDTFANEMEIEICEDSYTPTSVWNYRNTMYEVGYELYHERRYQVNLHSPIHYNGFLYNESQKSSSDSITKGNELPEVDTNEKNESFEIKTDLQEKIKASAGNLVKITHTSLNTEFKITVEPKKKWLFYWITVLQITISKDKKHKYILFNPDKSNDYDHKVITIYYCKTYIGEDGEEMENTNGPENDLGIQVSDAKPELGEKSKEFDNHLVKTQIIPMRMFHTLAARRATCIYLNFTFIWETIANGYLKKIDLFVYAIYREWLELQWMDIHFGIYGHLEELNQVTEKQISSKDDIISRSTPKLIFRLVRLLGLNEVHYGVVIVIHNVLEPVKDIDRICSTEDEVEGWDDIKNTDSATGFSYTCPYTEEVLSKLELNEESSPFEDRELLKLNKFLIRNNETSSSVYRSFLDSVKNRLQRIKELKIED